MRKCGAKGLSFPGRVTSAPLLCEIMTTTTHEQSDKEIVSAERTATRRGGTLHLLHNADFRLFWLGACTSFIGSWVQIIAMGLLVYQMTGSKEQLGVIAFVGGIPTTALMLFGGVIADRSNKRALVLATQTLFALNAFALAALTWTNRLEIWHIIVLAFVNGLVFAVDGPARQSMITDLVAREDLSAGIALQSASFNLARVIGPIVGSLLYARLGVGWCFFLNGVSFAAVILALLLIRTDLTRRGDSQASVWKGFLEGVQYLRSNRTMRGVVSLTAMTSVFVFSAYSTLMPALAKDLLSIEEKDPRYGWLFSAIGIGSLLGVVMVGQFAARERRGLLMTVGALVFAGTLLLLVRTTLLWAAIPLFLIVGLAAIAQLATANTLTQSLAPENLRGRAVSIHMFAMAGLQPFGALLAGKVAQHSSVTVALTFGASVLLVYTLGQLLLRPAVARLK